MFHLSSSWWSCPNPARKSPPKRLATKSLAVRCPDPVIFGSQHRPLRFSREMDNTNCFFADVRILGVFVSLRSFFFFIQIKGSSSSMEESAGIIVPNPRDLNEVVTYCVSVHSLRSRPPSRPSPWFFPFPESNSTTRPLAPSPSPTYISTTSPSYTRDLPPMF